MHWYNTDLLSEQAPLENAVEERVLVGVQHCLLTCIQAEPHSLMMSEIANQYEGVGGVPLVGRKTEIASARQDRRDSSVGRCVRWLVLVRHLRMNRPVRSHANSQ